MRTKVGQVLENGEERQSNAKLHTFESRMCQLVSNERWNWKDQQMRVSAWKFKENHPEIWWLLSTRIASAPARVAQSKFGNRKGTQVISNAFHNGWGIWILKSIYNELMGDIDPYFWGFGVVTVPYMVSNRFYIQSIGSGI